MIITSPNNERIKELTKLKQSKYRTKHGLYLVEGSHLVAEAFKANALTEVFIIEGESLNLDTKVTIISKSVMQTLSCLTTPTTMIGVCKIPKDITIGNKVLCLDDIQDPGNLGTIIRSAAAFNIDTILLGSGSVDLYNEKVLRATQGIHFGLEIAKLDLAPKIKDLKASGYYIYGTDVNDGIPVTDINPPAKFVLIMGNEGRGMSEVLSKLSDQKLYLDINNKCESLNVAVATSIILYELGKR